jgi:RNA polymerase sigma-70 factor (ECF subfamily)
MKAATSSFEDVDLVAGIRRGESAAESALYEKFSARVYYLAIRELRSPEDAEDARAETFLRVLQAIRQDKVHSPQALASFILGTTSNVIREISRRNQKTSSLEDEEIEETDVRMQSSPFLDLDTRRTIEQVARRLKSREQAFLRMYYYEELPQEEIARRLGIKEERVRLIKSRALKSFREIYERLTKKS